MQRKKWLVTKNMTISSMGSHPRRVLPGCFRRCFRSVSKCFQVFPECSHQKSTAQTFVIPTRGLNVGGVSSASECPYYNINTMGGKRLFLHTPRARAVVGSRLLTGVCFRKLVLCMSVCLRDHMGGGGRVGGKQRRLSGALTHMRTFSREV